MLAQHINLSERHLTRIFRQEIGLTPAQWLERERVSKARLLIEKEKLPAKNSRRMRLLRSGCHAACVQPTYRYNTCRLPEDGKPIMVTAQRR